MSELVPVRDLAKYGIITDRDPYDLPVGAWSFGVNARFRNGKITRGPVWRDVVSLNPTPRYIVGYSPTSGVQQTFVGHLNGRVYLTAPSGQTDYSIASYVNNNSETLWTSTHLADLIYINRSDHVPWYLPSSGTQFAVIPAWNSTWRAGLIRASNTALVAFNITQGATNYPTGVLTSSFALAGAPPASFDYTTPSTNATFNQLTEMESSIVDACALHNDMYIYGDNETWLMQFISGTQIWAYRKVFDNRGAISGNCSVEVQGKHYVFAKDDIWMHDGVTPQSIADERVREFIFANIDLSKSNRCFVSHNAQLKEIGFHFISGDQRTAFQPYGVSGFDGCNRIATYNYADDNWTFDDAPYVYAASPANVDTVLTYATVSSTYATQGGTYADTATSTKRPLCYVGDVASTYSLTSHMYAFDLYGAGSIVPYPVDTHATAGMYLETSGIDLDQVGADLPGYKTLSTMFVQGRLGTSAQPVQFVVGAADFFTTLPVYSPMQTWDGATLYKLDFNMAGRYLALQITYPDYQPFTFTGLDLLLFVTGER